MWKNYIEAERLFYMKYMRKFTFLIGGFMVVFLPGSCGFCWWEIGSASSWDLCETFLHRGSRLEWFGKFSAIFGTLWEMFLRFSSWD